MFLKNNRDSKSDGAPFGRYDQSCALLVSLLNVGKRFLSNKDNFMIFGANCSESCKAVERYVAQLGTDNILGGQGFQHQWERLQI